jgi:hypothetical protein
MYIEVDYTIPMTQEEIDRILSDREFLEDNFEKTVDLARESDDPIPFEITMVPDIGVYVRTIVEGHLVDVSVRMPWPSNSDFRMAVDIDETGDEPVFINLSDLVCEFVKKQIRLKRRKEG